MLISSFDGQPQALLMDFACACGWPLNEDVRYTIKSTFRWHKVTNRVSLYEHRIMQHKTKSIRPFIGAKDFEMSRRFYKDLGFEESVLSNSLSLFRTDGTGFYLQNAYVKDWVDNTMVFVEVDDVERHWREVKALGLPAKYSTVRLSSIQTECWGKEYFLHDPSGVLWHFGEFAS